MKICYVNYHNPLVTHGGAERIVFREAELVAQSGNDVILITTHGGKELSTATLNNGKIKVWFLPNVLPFKKGTLMYKIMELLLSLRNPLLGLYVDRILRKERPDLVHIHYYGPLSISVVNTAKRLGCKVIQTFHGYHFECPRGSLYKRSGRICSNPLPFCKIYKEICRKTMLKCDSIVAVSSYVKERLIKARYNPNTICLVPNCSKKISENFATRPDNKEILFVGRMVKAKGVHVLIKALAKTKKTHKEGLIVNLIGDGEHKAYFESLAKAYGVDVNFLGGVPDSILEEHYQEAYLTVVPSLFPELFAIVILEAMFHGKPVIASKAGGTSDLVLHGQTGFLFEPNDVDALANYIEILLADEELAISMGNRALKHSKKFSDSNHLKKLLNLYNKVSFSNELG